MSLLGALAGGAEAYSEYNTANLAAERQNLAADRTAERQKTAGLNLLEVQKQNDIEKEKRVEEARRANKQYDASLAVSNAETEGKAAVVKQGIMDKYAATKGAEPLSEKDRAQIEKLRAETDSLRNKDILDSEKFTFDKSKLTPEENKKVELLTKKRDKVIEFMNGLDPKVDSEAWDNADVEQKRLSNEIEATWNKGQVTGNPFERRPTEEPTFGNRRDGSDKDSGWLGTIKRPDGNVSTEVSIGVNLYGKEVEIPTMVPGLTDDEIKTLLPLKEDDEKKIPDTIINKAVAHAKKRIASGKSPFFNSKIDTRSNPEVDALTEEDVSKLDAQFKSGGILNRPKDKYNKPTYKYKTVDNAVKDVVGKIKTTWEDTKQSLEKLFGVEKLTPSQHSWLKMLDETGQLPKFMALSDVERAKVLERH